MGLVAPRRPLNLPGMAKQPEEIIRSNRDWAAEKLSANPSYFRDMARGQSPQFLWIGCSDSRVPAEDITGSSPGELFVARNVANLVVHTDMNLMSVIEYAVTQLKVQHIVVCGHTDCGGVRAAMSPKSYGMIDKWLRNIRDLAYAHRAELEPLSPEARERRLIELNVIEQARNLTHSCIVQRAWNRGRDLTIHGWLYEMETGLLRDLIAIDKAFPIPEAYRYDFSA